MKIAAGTALLAAMILTTIGLAATTLAAYAGPDGNPNRQPYASDPGGTMAVKPATVGTVTYDPFGTPAPFADMQPGQVAVSPPPPLPMAPPPANRPPRSR